MSVYGSVSRYTVDPISSIIEMDVYCTSIQENYIAVNEAFSLSTIWDKLKELWKKFKNWLKELVGRFKEMVKKAIDFFKNFKDETQKKEKLIEKIEAERDKRSTEQAEKETKGFTDKFSRMFSDSDEEITVKYYNFNSSPITAQIDVLNSKVTGRFYVKAYEIRKNYSKQTVRDNEVVIASKEKINNLYQEAIEDMKNSFEEYNDLMTKNNQKAIKSINSVKFDIKEEVIDGSTIFFGQGFEGNFRKTIQKIVDTGRRFTTEMKSCADFISKILNTDIPKMEQEIRSCEKSSKVEESIAGEYKSDSKDDNIVSMVRNNRIRLSATMDSYYAKILTSQIKILRDLALGFQGIGQKMFKANVYNKQVVQNLMNVYNFKFTNDPRAKEKFDKWKEKVTKTPPRLTDYPNTDKDIIDADYREVG